MTLAAYFRDFMQNKIFKPTSSTPVIDEPDEHLKIYIVGDLDGRLSLIIKMFIEEKLIEIDQESDGTIDFKWIAEPNVYVVQCGDQIDASRVDGNSNMMYEVDLSVPLFFEYMRHISKNKVLSILGNHEVMNMASNFQFVADKDKKDINKRIQMLTFNGLIGRVFRNRHFALTINDMVFTHGCLRLDDVQKMRPGITDLNELCLTINSEFHKLTQADFKDLHKFEDTDFYKAYLHDEYGSSSIVWGRNTPQNMTKTNVQMREKRLTQDPRKNIYVRGHDKVEFPSMISRRMEGYMKVPKISTQLAPTQSYNIMSNAYSLDKHANMPYSIIETKSNRKSIIAKNTFSSSRRRNNLIYSAIHQFNRLLEVSPPTRRPPA